MPRIKGCQMRIKLILVLPILIFDKSYFELHTISTMDFISTGYQKMTNYVFII